MQLSENLKRELKALFTFWDERFDPYRHGPKGQLFMRDLLAANVVALISIPLCLGYAIASGMRPEQGLIAAAFAALVGGVFGGSRFQVMGPTAGLIPIIGDIVNRHDMQFLILCAAIAGVVMIICAVLKLGRFFSLVPHSVIVGFTLGIALIIMVSQVPNLLGIAATPGAGGTGPMEKIFGIPDLLPNTHLYALFLGIFTFLFVRLVHRISVYIPAPLIAMILCTWVTTGKWRETMIPVIATSFGDIGGELIAFTPPSPESYSILDTIGPVASIVILCVLEILLCASMADRLASAERPEEKELPANLNKELVGGGMVNIIVPMVNGMPCSGAISRTAANLQAGGVSPFASCLKGVTVLLFLLFFVRYLNMVPMSFIAGLLIFIAASMVKSSELKKVRNSGGLHVFLMIYTAIMTLVANLSTAVISAVVFYYLTRWVARTAFPDVVIEYHQEK